jgi:hypothetical protein
MKLAALAVGGSALWLWLDRSMPGLLLASLAAAGGTVVELALTHLGMFRHTYPDWSTVPMWLPALYFASGPSFGQFARRLRVRA